MAVASRGIQAIPVGDIVGSVGRSHELQPNFMAIPRPHGDDHFNAIRARTERGQSLPPIDVYKLHDRYYVLDGNHRVAAARKVGLASLDAVVTAYRPARVPAAA
jgi:ParB-like chromosome segregation protein Spo0J